jgi:hypothetical protein
MIDLLLDWRSLARWCASAGQPLAGDVLPAPDPMRYVWRWMCERCERFYMTICHAPAQPCPACGSMLARVGGVWDLQRERAPRWWADPGEAP